MYLYILLLVYSILSITFLVSNSINSMIEDRLVFELLVHARHAKAISHELYMNNRFLEEIQTSRKNDSFVFLVDTTDQFSKLRFSQRWFSLDRSLQVLNVINMQIVSNDIMKHMFTFESITFDSSLRTFLFKQNNYNLHISLGIRGGKKYLGFTYDPSLPQTESIIKADTTLETWGQKMVHRILLTFFLLFVIICTHKLTYVIQNSTIKFTNEQLNIFLTELENVVGIITPGNFGKITKIFGSHTTLINFLKTLQNKGLNLTPFSALSLSIYVFFIDITNANIISFFVGCSVVIPSLIIAGISFFSPIGLISLILICLSILCDMVLSFMVPQYYCHWILFHLINFLLIHFMRYLLQLFISLGKILENLFNGSTNIQPQPPIISIPSSKLPIDAEIIDKKFNKNILFESAEAKKIPLPVVDAEILYEQCDLPIQDITISEFMKIEDCLDKIVTPDLTTYVNANN